MADKITPISLGTSDTLTWVGASSENDPAVADNSPSHDIPGSPPLDKTAMINLTDHGSFNLNSPDTAMLHVKVNLTGGGEAALNVLTGLTNDPDISVSIDSSTLDLQANMSFGKLSVHGGTTFMQGDSHFNGTNVLLDTKLDGFGSIELGAAGSTAGRLELKSDLPSGLTINVLDNPGEGGANHLILDTTSTTAGGQINLQNAFAEIARVATSYTLIDGELDLYANGTKFDALNIGGSTPLSVAVTNGATFIYNCDASILPLGGSVTSAGSTHLTVLPTPG